MFYLLIFKFGSGIFQFSTTDCSAWYLSYPKTYYIIYLYHWFQQYAECCLKHSDKNSSHCKLFTVQRERHGPIPSQFKCSGHKHPFKTLRIAVFSRNFPQQQQANCAPFAQSALCCGWQCYVGLPSTLSGIFRHPQPVADGLQVWTKVILVVICLVSSSHTLECWSLPAQVQDKGLSLLLTPVRKNLVNHKGKDWYLSRKRNLLLSTVNHIKCSNMVVVN